jgi:hypothetical protein
MMHFRLQYGEDNRDPLGDTYSQQAQLELLIKIVSISWIGH